ncbi:MAG TPA: fructose-bisphosphatase class III [Kofleriaceae bacterium]|nr:fructose-bisphosphatase class III [Kofleriaceae bacterium]
MTMDLVQLRTLAKIYPNPTAVLAELANLESILSLPKPTVHVVSDVHGEHVKLRAVINNASGSLRPLLERLFGATLASRELDELLTLFYYPRETWTALDAATRATRLPVLVAQATVVLRELARRYTLKRVERTIPDPLDRVVLELMFGTELARSPAFLARLVAPFVRNGRDLDLVRMLARVIRNLSVGELVVAGDLGDRGPRIDLVIDLLEHQPNVLITWGNHDADWMAACLGHPAAIATVIRLSLRYQRLGQLVEGYGISLAPLEELVRLRYADDPAERFRTKGDAGPDALQLARMQKAIAIIQFKLEGELFLRKPSWGMAHRAMLHQVDREKLLDHRFPTVDWSSPYQLSADEQSCMQQLVRQFVRSPVLWRQMSFVASRGVMLARRDRCAIFHGCVPVDDNGQLLGFEIDGAPRAGRELFTAFETVVQRAFRTRNPDDIDLVFYLWTGPRSPCFGKDKMATFETYFFADQETYEETKNPYFSLIHDAGFCAHMLEELGVDPTGYLINGHVPVKLDAGEQPIKRSHHAITIDGAFAAAYGDKGFSLVLDAQRMYLAQHHHVDEGGELVPTVADVETYAQPRTVGDTETGEELRAEIGALQELLQAFDSNQIRPV